MMNGKPLPIDSKREEFRKYLERGGVLDAFTKVLASLYEKQEKPDDALDFVHKSLSSDRPETLQLADALKDLENEKLKVLEITKALEEANEKIAKLEKEISQKGQEPMAEDIPAQPNAQVTVPAPTSVDATDAPPQTTSAQPSN